MNSFENLGVAHVFGFDEDAVRSEAEEDKRWGDEFDEDVYRGLNPEVISSLLDAVGARGDSPIMAGILFRAGIQKPMPDFRDLYGSGYNYTQGEPHRPALFGVFIDGDSLQRNSLPDALLLAQGFSRKAYRGFEIVMTDFWVNPDSPAVNAERELRDEAQRAMLTDYHDSNYVFVEQNTVLHEMGGIPEKTLADLSIQSEDYAEGYGSPQVYDRMAKLEDITRYTGQPELLKKFRDFYAATEPDVEAIGGEGEDLYEHRLNESEINALNTLQGFAGIDCITGLSIDREDRPAGSYMYRDDEDVDPFYTNGWGDMTIVLNIERDTVVTSYTLRVYSEGGQETYLRKHTTEQKEFSNWLSKEASRMLASIEDPLDKATKLNEIDQFEYRSLLKLVRHVQAVTALT